MHRLDDIRWNTNITDQNYIPTHLIVCDACPRPIGFIETNLSVHKVHKSEIDNVAIMIQENQL